MNNEIYEAGICFGNNCFVRFKYDADAGSVDITVIDSEETYTGTAELNAQE